MADPTDVRTCSGCGTQLPLDASYCLRCGARQVRDVAVRPSTAADYARMESELAAALAPQYQVVRRIGKGGMGSVFLAREPVLKRSVAVKVLAPELAAESTARSRFQREAQAVAALSHPNVIPIHSVGTLQDGTPYFVMQHVDGGNLEERLEREGPMEVEEAKRVLGQVASALAAAHSKGIIHRDVKPSNVLHDPDSGRVLVSDFGIAAVQATAEIDGPTRLTQTGTFVGTPEYMSPEQLLGEPVTERSDVYALGLLAYHLLTGAGPYPVESPRMLFAAHLRDAPRDLGEVRADVDPELRELARTCLAKAPEERPTADELVSRLRPETGGLLEWPPPGLERLQGALRRPALLLLIGSVAAIAPPLVALQVGTAATVAPTSLGRIITIVAGALGLLLVGAGLVQLIRVLESVRRSVRLGHAWGVVLEVLADGRGDGGAVIAGTREYTGLQQHERGAIRRERLIRLAALLLAAAAPLPAFAFMVRAASRGALPPGATLPMVLAPSALFLAVAVLTYRREARKVAGRRRAMDWRSRMDDEVRRLVPSWYASFRQVVGAGQPGVGPVGRAAVARGVAILAGLLLVGCGLLSVPVLAVSAGGLLPIWNPRFSATEERVREAEVGRRFRIPVDESISTEQAGVLLARLAPPSGGVEAGLVRPVDDAVEAFAYPPSCTRAFGEDFPLPRPLLDFAERVAAGVTPDERACLTAAREHPGFDILAAVAPAPGLDLEAAYLDLPAREDLAPHQLPISRLGTVRVLTYVGVAWSALATADGDRAQAERTLREILSVGVLLMDDSRFLISTLVGAVIAGVALDGLERHYRMAGDDDLAAGIAAAKDSARAVTQTLELQSDRTQPWDPRAVRAAALARVQDGAALRALRWEMLVSMSVYPCTNVRELLFGPAPDLQEAWEQARADLVRRPLDAELFRIYEEALTRLARQTPDRLPVRFARALAGLLGNTRLQGCVVAAGS